MRAGALHTILADGVWTPQRAHNIQKNCNGKCLLCGDKDAGVNHLWWDCPSLNKYSDLGYLNLKEIRRKENNQTECCWNTGVITKYWTIFP
eukprot:13910439-Heterocapsa_arctica.AAC.1